MNRKLAFAGMIFLAVSIGLGIDSAYAQESSISLTDISFDQEGIIIVIGVSAGLITAWQGFSKTNTPFNVRKFMDRVIASVIVSVGIAMASFATQTETGLFMYVLVFFAAMGATQVVIKQSQPKKA